MMRILFLLLFCLMNGAFLFAQKQTVFTFLHDDSTIKAKYLTEAKLTSQQTVAGLQGSYVKEYKKIYQDRLENVSEIVNSSRSITDDKAHPYLQAVLQKIVSANPTLQPLKLRVFFTRDWWPNAYSMGDGTIVVNAGLFIFLKNEGELAFTLCHELAHFYLNHGNQAIEKYVETVNDKSFQDELKKLSKEEYRVNERLQKLSKGVVFNSRRHNREKEAEADRQGFSFFKNTGYNALAAKTCLQMLGKIDDSLLYKPVDLQQLFDFPEQPFNNKWVRKESSIFSQIGKDDGTISQREKDSLKTHPDCEKRLTLLSDSITRYVANKPDFKVDSNKFFSLKNIFAAEINEETFKTNNLSRNLYFSLQQLQLKDLAALAHNSVLRCLLQLYEDQQEHTFGKAVDTENKFFPADYNLLLRMLSRIRLDELAAITKAYAAKHNATMQVYPEWQKQMQKVNHLNP